MSESNATQNDDEAPAAESGTAQAAGDGSTTEAQAAGGTEAAGGDTAADKAAAEARREAQNLRKRLRDAEAKLQEQERAGETEAEKLRREAQEANANASAAQNELREARLLREIVKLQEKLQLADADLAFAAILRDSSLEWDDKQAPTNVEAVLTQMLKDKPALKRQAARTTDTGGSTQRGGGGEQETDAQKRARLLGGGPTIWDPAQVAQHGGGVVMPVGAIVD